MGTNASVGSAFGVGDQGEETDVFVTNRHVVTGDTYLGEASGVVYIIEERVTGIYILLDNYAYNRTTGELDTSRSIPCTMIYQGETEADDVAVLRTAEPVPGRVALALQDSEDTLGLSDPVTAIGYPLLSDTNTNEGYLLASVDDATITDGTVARFFDSVSISAEETLGRVIQHTADINGGNSGGPLVDANGIVVGINTWVGNDGGPVHHHLLLRPAHPVRQKRPGQPGHPLRRGLRLPHRGGHRRCGDGRPGPGRGGGVPGQEERGNHAHSEAEGGRP